MQPSLPSSPELFHFPKLKLCPHETLTPHPLPQLLPHHLLPVSVDLTHLGPPVSEIRQYFSFLCLAFLTEHQVLKVHPCSRCLNLLPFLRLSDIPWIDGAHFIYSSPVDGYLGCVHLPAGVNHAEISCTSICSIHSFQFLPYITKKNYFTFFSTILNL